MAGVTPQSATRNRFSDSARRATFGTWLLAASIAVSLALAIFNYVWHGNGIHGTAGSLLVVISTALMLAAFIATAAWPMARWLRNVLIVLIALDIVGTGFAAYMLEAYLVVAAMLVAAVGVVASRIPPQPSRTAAALPAWAESSAVPLPESPTIQMRVFPSAGRCPGRGEVLKC